MGALKADLGDGVELVETHISWVFLGSDEVWKVKKPVDLGFLSFQSPERRRAACEAEVSLNRRLAEGVYLGVAPVVRDPGGRHRIRRDLEYDPDRAAGTPVDANGLTDWAVHMTRLPEARRADVRLAEDELTGDALDRVAADIARFHERARCDEETARFGTPDVIAQNVRENFEQTRDGIRAYLDDDEAREIESWQTGSLQDHADTFRARIEQGRIRDGHGDLRLEHVYLPSDSDASDEPVTIVDCIEFNERFRYADVCADVAFLSMDLAWHGRVDLAERFLAAYARDANDYALYRVVDFYESYRAYVRGKIAALLAADPDVDARARERAASQARRYFLLALSAERRLLVAPAVVAVGGVIASGKSTVGEQIAHAMQAPVVGSDRTRKHLAGAQPTENIARGPWEGAYASSMTERVYDEVISRGDAVLSSGRPVVLDASFRTRAMRERARELARRHGVAFYFVECRATPESCKERLRERARQGSTVSDGRLELLDDFISRWEPVDEGEHLVIETTSRPVDDNVAYLREQLPCWPAGLRG